jgi:hypothetical protein
MPLRIRVSTRAATFEERKQQHVRLGYRIEDERPIPVNGLCSFTAVKEDPSDTFDYVGEAEMKQREPRTCDAAQDSAQSSVRKECWSLAKSGAPGERRGIDSDAH